MERRINTVDYSAATISSTAGTIFGLADSGMPTSKPATAQSFVGIVEDAAIRVRGDGTAPTSSEGQLLYPGDIVALDEAMMGQMQFIRATTADGKIKGHFYNVELGVVLLLIQTRAIEGQAASDGPERGNPVMIGGSVDDTSPASAAEGDARRFRSTPEGNQIVELYKDNNALSPIAAMPGASEVIQDFTSGTANSTARDTVATPTSGKKIRIISVNVRVNGAVDSFEVYFGTGTNITSNTAKAITQGRVAAANEERSVTWPDGAGPVGAVDEVLSIRKTAAVAGENLEIIAVYREE